MNKQYIIDGFMLLSFIMLPGSLVAEDIPVAGENIARMEVDFTWTEKHTCTGLRQRSNCRTYLPPLSSLPCT